MKANSSAGSFGDQPTWQTIIFELWRLNHATFRGRMPMERFEDLLCEIEFHSSKQIGRRLRDFKTRRVKSRNVKRIQRLENKFREVACRSADHGAKFFSELQRYLDINSPER